jgi:hypothetical protein
MQQLLPLERPLLLDRVQVTYASLCQAHARLGGSLVLFEHVRAVRSKYCKQALKTVRAMGGLAASLHAYLLTLDSPISLTVGLHLRLGVLVQYTNKAARTGDRSARATRCTRGSSAGTGRTDGTATESLVGPGARLPSDYFSYSNPWRSPSDDPVSLVVCAAPGAAVESSPTAAFPCRANTTTVASSHA